MTRDEYVAKLLAEDEILMRVRRETAERGMPSISVPPALGRLLQILVQTSGASRVLEIGSLGGYSGICLARGLQPGGKLTCLELNPDYAQFAQQNIRNAGLNVEVEYRIGPALDSLRTLVKEGVPFDFFFIDADKENYPNYLNYALELAKPGAIICADNTLQHDRVCDPANTHPSVEAMRTFNERMMSDSRLQAVLLPVHDGFSIARVCHA
ncbi:MAG: O-methyltransferase [Alicyclobacillus sp.]|nr:O-methyltransferase [Alicyclobacillus sp.]